MEYRLKILKLSVIGIVKNIWVSWKKLKNRNIRRKRKNIGVSETIHKQLQYSPVKSKSNKGWTELFYLDWALDLRRVLDTRSIKISIERNWPTSISTISFQWSFSLLISTFMSFSCLLWAYQLFWMFKKWKTK